MSNDDTDSREVTEAPSVGSADGAVADMARESQEKPQDQLDQEKSREELRKARQTNSSEMLVDLVIDDEGASMVKVFQQPVDSAAALYSQPDAVSDKGSSGLDRILNLLPGDGSVDISDIALNDNRKKDPSDSAPKQPADKGSDGQSDKPSDPGPGKTRDLGDGVKVTTDAEGKITRIEGPGGASDLKYTSDQAGKPQLTEIDRPGGFKYQKEGDGTWTYRNDKGEQIAHYKSVEAGADGAIKIVNDNGDVSTLKPNGEVTNKHDGITTNSDGNVSRVDYPGGRSAEVQYGKDNKPTQITETADGKTTTWKKEADGWNKYDQDGSKITHIDGDIKVDKNGDITFGVNKKGDLSLVKHPDGTDTETPSDGSKITRQADGTVIKIEGPGGASDCKYTKDQDGKPVLTEIDRPGGFKYQKEADGSWSYRNEKGEQIQRYKSVDVTQEGNIKIVNDNGDISTLTPGGDVRTKHGALTTNSEGNVTDIEYPKGRSAHIEYDQTKNPKQITETQDGKETTWKKEANGWNRYDQDGKNIGHWDGAIRVDKNGDIAFDGPQKVGLVKHADGSDTDIAANGVKVTRDVDGKIAKVEGPGGASDCKYTNDKDGKPVLTEVDRPGGFKYQKEADGSWTYRNEKGEQIQQYKSLEVGENGEIKLTNSDGSVSTLEPTGDVKDSKGQVMRDGLGNVSEIRDGDGAITRIVYKDGQPSQIVEPDQSRWLKAPDGSWTHFKEGKAIERSHRIQVRDDGDIAFVNKDGSGTVRHPDRTSTEAKSDASTIERDKNGDVTEIDAANGKVTKVEYDSGNPRQPNKVLEADKSRWEKGSDGTWTHVDENGKELGKSEGIQVRKDGDIVFTDQSGAATMRHPDGSETDIAADMSVVQRDPDGKVTEIAVANGKPTKIQYEGGEVKHIDLASGKTWTKEGDRYVQRGKDGKETGITADKIEVTKNGDVKYTSKETDQLITVHRDGIITDVGDGKVQNIHYPDGTATDISYEGKDVKKVTFGSGKTWTKEGDMYVQRDAQGKETGIRMDKVEVNENGDIKFTSKATGQEITVYRDKTQTDVTDGKVTGVRYPNGTNSEIDYEGNEVKKVSFESGKTWTKEGNAYVQRDSQGHETGVRVDNITVTANGDIHFVSKETDQEIIVTRDGQHREKKLGKAVH